MFLKITIKLYGIIIKTLLLIINLTDAFALRLFGGQLVKTQNARNLRFEEIYNNPRRALIASEQALYKLIEYEALLWEY